MELVGLAVTGAAMIAVVFTAGVLVEVFVTRRLGVGPSRRADSQAQAQAHQQAVRSQLGGFGPGGGDPTS